MTERYHNVPNSAFGGTGIVDIALRYLPNTYEYQKLYEYKQKLETKDKEVNNKRNETWKTKMNYLACPWRVFCPDQYLGHKATACQGFGFPDMTRLRQHVQSTHILAATKGPNQGIPVMDATRHKDWKEYNSLRPRHTETIKVEWWKLVEAGFGHPRPQGLPEFVHLAACSDIDQYYAYYCHRLDFDEMEQAYSLNEHEFDLQLNQQQEAEWATSGTGSRALQSHLQTTQVTIDSLDDTTVYDSSGRRSNDGNFQSTKMGTDAAGSEFTPFSRGPAQGGITNEADQAQNTPYPIPSNDPESLGRIDHAAGDDLEVYDADFFSAVDILSRDIINNRVKDLHRMSN